MTDDWIKIDYIVLGMLIGIVIGSIAAKYVLIPACP